MIGIDLHLIHVLEGSLSSIFFPQNTTGAHFIKGKSTVSAPRSRRQSIAPSSRRQSIDTGAPSMKGKSADLPKEKKGKK